MEMCRFAGPDDNEYQKVAAAFTRTTGTRPKLSGPEPTPELIGEQKKDLLASLRFDQIDARHMTIQTAHAKTCRWLLQKSEYLDWCDPGKLAEHNGFLWIKGKPGAGKSTLMKFALANTRRDAKDEAILSFFFNARGDDLEKSASGLFRSLLVQLLEQLSSTMIPFSTLGSPIWKSNVEWTLESLQSMFEEVVLNLRDAPIICFIDALDECDDQQIRDMVYFFERLGEKTIEAAIPFRVCFASRHYPHITMSKEHNLVLEGQEGHHQDIVNYLSAKLKIGHSKLAEQIRADVQASASGVFMWIVLVTGMLNREFDGGRIHRLRKRIQEIPADLHELFRNILTRDTSNREELLLCIQWVLFARKPLTPTELYFAVLSGIDPNVLLEWDRDATTPETIAKYILDCSKGLTEITKSKSPTVQFIHESVRDFLLKENGLREVWSDLGVDFQAASQDTLKECCLNCIRRGIIDVDIPDTLPKASSTEAANLRRNVGEANPILEYATQNVLDHAEAAVKGGSGQEGFLNTFPLSDWMRWQNIFEKRQVRHYKPTPSLLYVLAERDLVSLIKLLPPGVDCLALEDQRYGCPFSAALHAGGEQQTLRAMLERISATLGPDSPFQERFKQYLESPNKSRVRLGLVSYSWMSLLANLSAFGAPELLALLLFTGRVEMEELTRLNPTWLSIVGGGDAKRAAMLLLDLEIAGLLPGAIIGRSPSSPMQKTRSSLEYALAGGQTDVAKHLICIHADKNLPVVNYPVLLELAIRNSLDTDIFKVLLEGLGNTNVPEFIPIKNEALLKAAALGQYDAMETLLQSGASIEATNDAGDNILSLINHESSGTATSRSSGMGQTPLHVAAQRGHLRTVDYLLQLGADIEAKNVHGCTALWMSSGNLLNLLCSRGASIESRSGIGTTPLMNEVMVNAASPSRLAALLRRGACVHARDARYGQTPLAFAVSRKVPRTRTVQLLLDNGAEIDAQESLSGSSPLVAAAGLGHYAIVALLISHGADIHVKDKNGLSGLARAARNGHSAVIELLLAKGANGEEVDWKRATKQPNSEAQETKRIETPTVCLSCLGRKFSGAALDVDKTVDGSAGGREWYW